MRIKRDSLLQFIKMSGKDIDCLAREIGIGSLDIEMLLLGQCVGINTSRKFIRYFGARESRNLIDWEAMGKKNPFPQQQILPTRKAS